MRFEKQFPNMKYKELWEQYSNTDCIKQDVILNCLDKQTVISMLSYIKSYIPNRVQGKADAELSMSKLRHFIELKIKELEN